MLEVADVGLADVPIPMADHENQIHQRFLAPPFVQEGLYLADCSWNTQLRLLVVAEGAALLFCTAGRTVSLSDAMPTIASRAVLVMDWCRIRATSVLDSCWTRVLFRAMLRLPHTVNLHWAYHHARLELHARLVLCKTYAGHASPANPD